jgi:RimJ/RimL family protein N-acetyltransferase
LSEAIRLLTPDDAEAYRAVRVRALTEHPDAFGRAIEEVETLAEITQRLGVRDEGRESFILGAFEDRLVGVTGCSRDRGLKHRHKALIWGMYVAPEARTRGLGRRLLLEAIARARTWPGLEQLALGVGIHNAPARALYRACGFEVFGVERHALKIGARYVDEEHMVLRLA